MLGIDRRARWKARESSRSRDGLIERSANAPVRRVDQLWERVDVSAFELRQLAVLDDQSRQFVFFGQLVQHVATGRDLPGGGAARDLVIQFLENLAELLRRADVEFAPRQFVNLLRELIQLLLHLDRKLFQHAGVDAESGLFHFVKQRDERHLDLPVDEVEFFLLKIVLNLVL